MTEKTVGFLLLAGLLLAPVQGPAQDPVEDQGLIDDIEKALMESPPEKAPAAPVDTKRIIALKAALQSSDEVTREVEGQLEEEQKLRKKIEADLRKANEKHAGSMLEIHDLKNQLEAAKSAPPSAGDDKALRGKIKGLEKELKKEEGLRKDAEKDLAEKDEDLKKLSDKLDAAGRDQKDDHKGDAGKQVAALEKSLKEEQDLRKAAEVELNRVKHELAQGAAVPAETEADESKGEDRKLLKKITRLEADLEKTGTQLAEAEAQLAQKDHEQDVLKKMIEKQSKDMEARIEDLEKLAAADGKEMSQALKEKLAQASDREKDLKKRIATLEDEATDLEKKARMDLAQANDSVDAADKRLNLLTRELESWKDRSVKAKTGFLKQEQALSDDLTTLAQDKKRLVKTVKEQADQNKVMKNLLEDRGDDLNKRLKAFEKAAETTAEKLEEMDKELKKEQEDHVAVKKAAADTEGELADARKELKAAGDALADRKRLFAFLSSGKPENEKTLVDRVKELKEDADVAAVAVEELKEEIRHLAGGGAVRKPIKPTDVAAVSKPKVDPAPVAQSVSANPARERLLQRLMEIRRQYDAANATADEIKRNLIDELKKDGTP